MDDPILVNRFPGIPLSFRMCGKQRTLSGIVWLTQTTGYNSITMSGGNAHQRRIDERKTKHTSAEVPAENVESHAIPETIGPKKQGWGRILTAYLRSIGAVAFTLAIGTILMENSFWWFVVLAYVAFIASLIDPFFEKGLGKPRYIFVLFFLCVMVIFTLKVVLGKVYFETTAQWTEGNYTAGSEIHGIKWQDGWSDLTISIFNRSETDIKDLDVEFLEVIWLC